VCCTERCASEFLPFPPNDLRGPLLLSSLFFFPLPSHRGCFLPLFFRPLAQAPFEDHFPSSSQITCLNLLPVSAFTSCPFPLLLAPVDCRDPPRIFFLTPVRIPCRHLCNRCLSPPGLLPLHLSPIKQCRVFFPFFVFGIFFFCLVLHGVFTC